MPYVWMDEISKVQTISENGIGFYPDDTAKEADVIGENGRDVRKTPSPYDMTGIMQGGNSGPGPNVDTNVS